MSRRKLQDRKTVKIIRSSTVPESIETFCSGLLRELQEQEGYEVVALSSPGEQLDRVAINDNVRTIAVPMARNISPLKDMISLWRLIGVMRREQPDMIHSLTPKAGLLCMIAARLCRVPIRIHTFTGLVFPTATGVKKRILMLTDRITCACATHVVPEGEGVKNDLTNHAITKKPLKVLGHGNIRGIDLAHYDPSLPEVREAARTIRRDDMFTFVFVGRMVGDKGINELVEAFVEVNKVHPRTRLILVGRYEPNLDPLHPDTVEQINSHPCIDTTGMQTDVRPWLASADILVFPSYREGFPNVVIEAGAMGLPAIVTDINGSREIIREGVNGTIIPPRDAKALYTALRQAVEQPDTVRAQASNARPLVASRYEQSYVRRCLKEYYKEILGQPTATKH